MKPATRYALVGLSALALLSLTHGLRASPLTDDAAVMFLLGVLPSFCASIAIPYVSLAVLIEAGALTRSARADRSFTLINLASCVWLILWEFNQVNSRALYFDVFDLSSTLIGAATGQLLFARLADKRVG